MSHAARPSVAITALSIAAVALSILALVGCSVPRSEPPVPSEAAIRRPEVYDSPRSASVPDVRGMSYAKAIATLSAAGFGVQSEELRLPNGSQGCPSAALLWPATGTEPPVGMTAEQPTTAIRVLYDHSAIPTSWPTWGHREGVAIVGSDTCFECHPEDFCAHCHVRGHSHAPLLPNPGIEQTARALE